MRLASCGFVHLQQSCASGDARREDSSAQAQHISAQRLQATLEKLSEIGRNPEGGVTRLGLSQTRIGRADLCDRSHEACRLCGARRCGRQHFRPGRGIGAAPDHLVWLAYRLRPARRQFDGPLGSLGAIEVIRALNDAHIHHALPARGRHLDQRGKVRISGSARWALVLRQEPWDRRSSTARTRMDSRWPTGCAVTGKTPLA